VPLIDAALDARTQLGDGCPPQLREAMRYSLLAPGKRIRPMLVLLSARACGGSVEAALPAACAVEMIHAYSLIHDDLPAMDDDDLRRGRPTCHKAFDEATAILAGDALLPLAFEILAREIAPPAVAVACCESLARAAGACGMAGGQSDDVRNEGRGARDEGLGAKGGERKAENLIPNPQSLIPTLSSLAPRPSSLASLESIHDRKTGAMIRVSLRLGALVAGADEQKLAALDDYGRCLGLAFQITDDLLDVRSTEAEMGKRCGKDAKHGKLTFPAVLGLDRSTQYARQLVDDARRAVAGFGPQAEGLRALAQFVLERNR
jgi:geranylgeranyl diphosphate synthase type II